MQVYRVMNAVSGDGDEQPILLFLLLLKQRLKQKRGLAAYSTPCSVPGEGGSSCTWPYPQPVLLALVPVITLNKAHAHFFALHFSPVSGFAALALQFSKVEWGRKAGRSWGGGCCFTEKKGEKSEKAVFWGLGMWVALPLLLPDSPFQTHMRKLPRIALSPPRVLQHP